VRKARALAPDYLDVWRVELTALRAINTDTSRAEAALLRQGAAGRFTKAQLATLAKQDKAIASQSWTEFGAGGGYERLNNGRDPWYQADIDVTHRLESGYSLYGFARVNERFTQQDETLGVGMYLPLGKRWLVQLEGAVGNDNQVLPKWALYGRVDFEVAKGFLLGAAYKRSQYLLPTVEIATFAVQKYWSNFRAGFTINASSVERNHPVYSRTAELDYYYGERSFVGISGASGSEAEFVNANRIVNRHTRSAVLRGRHWVDEDTALEYALNRSDVGDIFRRYGIRLGIRWRY
jgi:YaiO family outer membrane protein